MTTMTTARKWVLYPVLAAALSSLLMGGVAIEYANYVNAKSQERAAHALSESQQKWCEIVRTLDDAYKTTPPQTPAGKHLAEEFARLRVDFQCDRN